jgi:hypothetical protein
VGDEPCAAEDRRKAHGPGVALRSGSADQLGHPKPSMTSDSYFGRGVTDTGAADVLEALT